MGGARRVARPLGALVALTLAVASPHAAAQIPGETPQAIPDSPLPFPVDEFEGKPAKADPHRKLRNPNHPFMAAGSNSNIHNDAYQSDVYNRPGPLGAAIGTSSAFFVRECASVTFDSRGRIVTICVGLDQPVLTVLDPVSLTPLSAVPLPPRPAGGDPLSNFAGGGYFYLDNRDRAVVPTSEQRIERFKVAADGTLAAGRSVDVSAALADDDQVIAVMPDWSGRIWFASKEGVVGYAGRRGTKVAFRDTGEPIGNSFAVDERNGVFIVTDGALYRFQAKRGKVHTSWRQPYPNIGETKPGQTQAGSGTTPTLMGRGLVAITDNARHMAVRVYRRQKSVKGSRLVCRKRVFDAAASSTDQSLIGTRRSIVVENNFGYQGPASVSNGAATSPGLERIDIDRDGRGCRTAWVSKERAPSVVPKLSLGSGLVYTYTKPVREDQGDPWYLTAIDFDTGKTKWRALAGTGLGYNNNFAPVSIHPDGGIAYVGVLGGITRFADD